jgi:hypothetical protein
MTWLLLVAIAAIAVWVVWRTTTAHGGAGHSTKASGTYARIRGPGVYASEVVGESFYAENFEQFWGPRAGTEDERFVDALLRLEDDNPHDNKAVGVYVERLKVGHLSKRLAREFRAALVRDGLAGRSEYAVAARLYAGGDERLFSVSLDLPES